MSGTATLVTVDTLAAKYGEVQVMPTSFAQQRFWVLEQLVADRSVYTLPVALRINGNLHRDALTAAFNSTIARHESLRTLFAVDGDAPAQVVLPSLAIDIPVVDLTAVTDGSRDERVAKLVAENANSAFDLSAGPLLRASLLHLSEDEHVLLVAVHHIVADGWSLGVLFDEIAQHYAAAVSGTAYSPEALPLQYPDFSVWQRKVMTGNAATRQLAFWREQLAGLEPLELPIDKSRPATFSAKGDKRELEIPASVVEGMRALAKRESATPSMAFLAAFFVLLHRYSGQSDLAVATIASGRLRPEVEPLIGLFVNTLAVRSAVNAEESFSALLKNVASASMNAQANQNVPFEHVVDALKLPHDQSRPPVVQVCFQLLEGLGNDPVLRGVAVSRVPSIKQTSKFELTLMLHPTVDGGLRAVFEYSSDLFDTATIVRMLSHYSALLQGIVRNSDAAVGRLPLMSDVDRRLLLSAWNNTAQPLPHWTLPARVLEQAERTPDAVAVRAGSASLTYRELAERSAALAESLRQSGIGSGDRVAVCVDRTPDLLVSLLATLRIGAAYVPVDASYPSDRISYVLGDAGAAAVITDAASAASLPWTSVPVIRVDEPRADANKVFECATIDAESPAYILYTSGSTGRPKGVVVPHRALANFLASMAERPGLAAGDAVVAVTTLAFDIAGLELWLPLIVGARIELASREIAMDGRLLAALVERTSAEVAHGKVLLQATPVTWRLLVEAGWNGTENLIMLCGGEGWPPGLAESLITRGHALWNVYGPTETTIWSSHAHVTQAGPPSLGEPLANTTLLVFERGGELAPVGVPGELCIGGAGLAHGYHNRPDLTAEKFVVRGDFGRVYRTGDLVVRRNSGRLDYLGRLDDQIKLRGHRIELGEIETALAAQPEVAQAIVAVRAVGVPAEPQLIAYIVPVDSSATNLSGALTARLRAALPAYMVPAIFVMLDKMPLTPNGKADRRALPTPDVQASLAVEYVAPRTPLEELIVSMLGEVLGREKIGVHDDFFAIGGHSLAAMRLAAKLGEACAANIPMRVVFESRTAEGIAAWMHANGIELDAELAAMMAELNAMSDDEARMLLAHEGSQGS